MFHLYQFKVADVRYFVAEQNWKAARNVILRLPENKNRRLAEIEGCRLKTNCSETSGILPAEKVFSQMAWWKCKCGASRFVAINDGSSCRCMECGREGRVVFKRF